MRIAFVGNQDNNAYRLCKWARAHGADAHLYLMAQEKGARSRPELVDRELEAGRQGYPPWIHTYDDRGPVSFLLPGRLARQMARQYDVVVTSGATGLLAANHFRKLPVVHYSLGSEVSVFPRLLFSLTASPAWRGVSLLTRRALRRVRKVITNYRGEAAVLRRLGHRDKIVILGFPEDTRGNRARVAPELLAELNARYSRYDRVFLWLSRLNFLNASLPECKRADVFLEAFERVVRDGRHNVRAVIGAHGADVGAFQALAAEKRLDGHIDYVPHLPFTQLLAYLSIANGILFDVPDRTKGALGGATREALSVGAVVIRGIDEELMHLCYGGRCPIAGIDDVETCYRAMVNVLSLNAEEFERLRKAHAEWAERYLHYDHNVPRFLDLLREVVFCDSCREP